MRQMLTDPMKVADLILVNRCQPGANKSPWRRQLKAVNPKTNIIFENTDGTSEDGVADEDLPYDMKSAVIEIKDEGIPTFYLDSLDHADRYDRKTVRLVGQAFADRSLPKGYYMFGRMAMTCCANDIQPIGWITQGIQKPSTKAYFRLTAQCKAVDAQGEKMLMLQEARAEIVPPPAEEYLNSTHKMLIHPPDCCKAVGGFVCAFSPPLVFFCFNILTFCTSSVMMILETRPSHYAHVDLLPVPKEELKMKRLLALLMNDCTLRHVRRGGNTQPVRILGASSYCPPIDSYAAAGHSVERRDGSMKDIASAIASRDPNIDIFIFDSKRWA